MSAVADTLRDLAAVLGRRGVRWYVFGAQAVAVRGAPRATQDVDVTVAVDRRHLPELVEDLTRSGFAHRFPDAADRLLAAGAVLPLLHRSGLEVDLVVAGSGLEAIALSRATEESLAGVRVPVAHATDLVVMKVLAGRGKDLDDARSLLASGQADPVEAEDLLHQLEEALDRSDLVSTLARLRRG